MRLKSFTANTMTEAMQQVRDTLGEDAVIVATREEKGKGVRLTAAVDTDYKEPHFEIGQRHSAFAELDDEDIFGTEPDSHDDDLHEDDDSDAADDWLQYDDEDEENAVVEHITDVMLRHGAPEDITDKMITTAMSMGLEEPHIAMIAAIEQLFSFRRLPDKAYAKPLMMVGPPGAGKTLAVAKLATRAKMNGLSVRVITTDTARAGSTEQLQAFTRILKIELERAETPEQLAKLLKDNKGTDQIIIDTSGANPFSPEEMKDLAKLTTAGDIETILVMPAGMDADESAEIARAYAVLGTSWMLSTRIDISRRMGGLLAAADQAGMEFADASNTPQVANGLTPMTPTLLTKCLMPKTKPASG